MVKILSRADASRWAAETLGPGCAGGALTAAVRKGMLVEVVPGRKYAATRTVRPTDRGDCTWKFRFIRQEKEPGKKQAFRFEGMLVSSPEGYRGVAHVSGGIPASQLEG